jgi:predicted negative regulator of RcsB-dependent stress response
MAYDLEEQEQLDNIKAWWKQNGSLITWSLVVVLAGYVAWITWTNYQGKQSSQASSLFEEVQMAVNTKEDSKIQAVTEKLTKDFSSTAYASMASFSAAKSSFELNDLKAAKKHLSWIVDQSKSAEYKAIARLRLAAIAIDEKSFDEGLKILAADYPVEFQGDVADRKGDIFYAQNKIVDAKTAYELALSKLSEKSPSKQLVQIKLDSLGGSNDQKDAINDTAK